MQYGITLLTTGTGSDPQVLAELAQEAEEAGWDGVFLWDCIDVEKTLGPSGREGCDPWIALAAIAMRTQRIRLGPMVTPLSRRRPWKVARETVTLDHLSRGRLILAVGLGLTDDGELRSKVRAQMLDEALAILDGLWSGQPFRFQGDHYHVEEMTFLPPPVHSIVL